MSAPQPPPPPPPPHTQDPPPEPSPADLVSELGHACHLFTYVVIRFLFFVAAVHQYETHPPIPLLPVPVSVSLFLCLSLCVSLRLSQHDNIQQKEWHHRHIVNHQGCGWKVPPRKSWLELVCIQLDALNAGPTCLGVVMLSFTVRVFFT